MAELGLKQLTIDNWQERDSVLSAFVRYSLLDGSTRPIDGDEWAREILAVELRR